MATFSDGLAEHFSLVPGGGVSTRAFTLATAPAAGQSILVLMYTANEGQTRSQSVPTITDASFLPRGSSLGATFEGRMTVWSKISDGTETGFTVDFTNDDIDFGNTMNVVYVDDGSLTTIVSPVFGSGGGPANYNADVDDQTLHWGGFYGNVAPAAPAGDSVAISTVDTNTFRRSLVTESGGATAVSWAAGGAGFWALGITDTTPVVGAICRRGGTA